ncbi:hypothetical protein [Embleya sp. AB8]|uniref:hypothetical protein n=1 Tax=Embleya sp. AB8 TaxID=3156304 RepID=UPI003C749630
MDVWLTVATVLAAGGTGAALGMRWSSRRRMTPPAEPTEPGAAAPPTIPAALYERARAESVAALRAEATARLADLAARTQALVPAAHPPALAAQLRALDACEAAAWVLRDADDLPDLAGVLVLVRHGVRALDVAADRAGRALPADEVGADDRFRVAVCLLNPLHGTAVGPLHWAIRGRTRLSVPACHACLVAASERTMADVLTQRVADGAYLAYYEIPAERSVWSATGFGAFGGDLVARVLDARPGGRRAGGG